ncbi:hypothetical protein SAMN05660866_02223 [Maribacter arcticus]|uniref:DUF7793 domain-containing protein n=2 Tax=Maribacter arcticus TaxID=561365 RepID=A0A1T5CED9_9FLAO|nr:hypothetical protein SAMN05660866_02223 [Maribacter arcticus]
MFFKGSIMENIITYEHATLWTDTNGILFCKINNLDAHNKLDFKSAQLYLEAIIKLTNGVPMPFLIDLRDTKGTFSIAAAQLLSKKFNTLPLVVSTAYVVNSLSINLLIQSYKRIYDTKIPFEIFKDMTSAKNYCLKYMN